MHLGGKKARAKAAGVRKAIADTERKLAELEQKIAKSKAEALAKPAAPLKREKNWYERFHHFTTSDGFLVLAGNDAKQNELLVARQGDRLGCRQALASADMVVKQ